MKFYFCELLNLVNVFLQIYFTDVFLGYQFTKYGREVFAVSEEDLNNRVDPMHKVFPKVAKCTFNKYGPSGSIQTHDALCVLPLNIINEKIYIFLYFWFVFLAAVSCVWLIYRLLTIFSHDLRVNIIFARSDRRVSKEMISSALSNPKHSGTERLGDYLMLYLITKNVNPLIIKVSALNSCLIVRITILFSTRMCLRRFLLTNMRVTMMSSPPYRNPRLRSFRLAIDGSPPPHPSPLTRL